MRIDIHRQIFINRQPAQPCRAQGVLRPRLGRPSLHQVIVRLDDLNGPNKGGVDKLCRVQIPLVGGAVVVIAEVQADLYSAVDKAMERANQSLTRKIRAQTPAPL